MRTSCLLPLLLCAGCAIEEQQSWAPLRPRAPITTEGGAQLEADPDGRILWRPAQCDLDASIGAALEDDPAGGVRVVGLLAAEGTLEVDDLIRAVWARPTPLPARGDEAPVTTGRGFAIYPAGGGQRPTTGPLRPRLVPPVLGEIRTAGHPVRSLADLRGYALCPCTLDLVVLRAGEEVALRAELAAGRPLEAPPWAPVWTRELGFEAVRVGDLPRPLRPDQVVGGDDDLLVTFVGEGSTIALRGLRPLDVIPHGARELTRAWPLDDRSTVAVWRARERAPRTVDFTPAASAQEREFLAPLFQASRPIPTHFRASSGVIVANAVDLEERWSYEPRTDRYARELRLDVGPVLPLLFRLDVEDGDGRSDQTSVGVGLFQVQLVGEAE